MVTYLKKNPIKLTIVVGLLGMVLYLFITADPPGYCGEQKRFLSDAEFIEIAVRDEFNTRRMNIDGSEASISSFHAKYPNCCHVYRGGDKSMGISTDSIVVHLVYEVNEKRFNETKEKYYENNKVIGPCGGEVLDSYGQGLTSIPKEY